MKNIYIFSGLGVDHRVFIEIRFPNHNPVHIKWIAPLAGEPIEAYAGRLANQIGEKQPVLLGLSFGGIMAIEVAKILKPEKIILLASAKSKNELPFYFTTSGEFNLHKLIPAVFLKQSNLLTNWLFGIRRSDKKLLAEILRDTDPVFLKWALDKIVNWQNLEIPQNLIHIHGTADRILPRRFVRADIEIPGAGHFMTVTSASRINEVLSRVLSK